MRFVEVEAEDDVAFVLKKFDEFECRAEICLRALGGVSEIEEKGSIFFRADGGEDGFKDISKNTIHLGDHGPVEHADEIGSRKGIEDDAFGGGFDDIGVGNVVKVHIRFEHNFAVIEFHSEGSGGVGDGDGGSFLSEVLKERMECRLAEGTDVVDA